jgi:glutathione peroxidase
VNGANTHPVYQHLKQAAPGILGSEGIKWNFTKFLIDKTGKVVKRYGSVDTPAKIESDIVALL